MKTGINISLKQRIYWSFSLLVCIFVLNSIITITTINSDKKLSTHLSRVVEPSLQVMEDLDSVFIESKMYTTNWVFLRFDQEDKDLLKKLQDYDYPAMKSRINWYSSQWENRHWVDSINRIFTGFEQLLVIEKSIMFSLKEFKDYDDPGIKLEAERKVEEEILPRTASLIKSLHVIHALVANIRIEENTKLEKSSMKLRMFIILLAIIIICAGFFLSVYMTKLIVSPVNRIRDIINNLGLGIIQKTEHYDERNEIGEMIHSVNNLSEKLLTISTFAHETGLRNFDIPFKPLSGEDTLGKALIAMRDNLKSSDERITEAQHIAKLGSWEWDLKTNALFWSDETHNNFDTDSRTFSPSFESYIGFIHPEDREYTNSIIAKCLQDHQPFSYELRLISNKNVAKLLLAQGKVVLNHKGEVIKMIGTGQDITERKRGEEKLAEEQELLRIIIENIPDQIYVKDTEGRFLHCNMPGAINAGCKSEADIIGKTDFDFFSPESAQQYFAVEQDIMKSGKSLINQEDYVPDEITGEPHWSLNTKVPFKDSSGKMMGLIGINRDITQRKISEKKIEDVNRELSTLFNSIDEVFFSVDMVHNRVIQISKTCEKLYGYKQSDFLSNYKLWLEIIHPEDKHVIENEDEILRRGEQLNNEYRIIRNDHTIRWVETKITPTLSKEGKLVRVDGVTSDITERKQTEIALERSFSLLEATIESTADGIMVVDFDGKMVMFNKKFVELWRIPEEILKTGNDEKAIACVLDQLTNPEQFVSKVKELYVHQEALSFDVLRFKDGRTFERYSQPQLINGNCVGRVWNFRDITERKLAEEKLFEVSQRLQLATRAAKVGIWDLDTVSNNLYWDDNMYGLYGIGSTDFTRAYEAWEAGLHPDDLLRGREEIQMAIRGEKEFDTEFRVVWPDKSIHYIKANASVHRDESGNALRIIGTNWDITESRQAEKALSLAQFSVDNATHAIYWIKDDGSFYNLNKAALDMLGYTFEELIKLSIPDIDPFYNREIWPEHWKDLRNKKSLTFITRQRRKDGVLIDVQVDAHYFRFDNMEMNCAFVYDITEQKKAESELRHSEERYRQIVETAQEGIWIIDENNFIIFFNKKICEILEYSYAEMKGKQLFDFMDMEGKKLAGRQIENRKQGINGNYDVRYITKSGRGIWTNISTSSIFSEDGKYKGSLAMVTDITKRKSDEDLLQKSQTRLALNNHELAQKNKELEQFAYVASHDLQEPLRTTISFVEIFKQQYLGKLDSKADKYLGYIVQASDRMRVLIEDLLDFSRIGINKEVEKVDCNLILKNVITDIDKAIKESKAELEAEHLPVISGYATELKQLFQNLVLNSIKFRKKNVPLKINIEAQKKNDYWQFAFTDNGIGIDQQHNERIFIIFQRLHTRSEYQGSGIGLSHCKKIVELHHGKIWVKSTPNEGSTFYFTIHSPKEIINEAKIKLHKLTNNEPI